MNMQRDDGDRHGFTDGTSHTDNRVSAGIVGGGLALAVLVIFVLQNTQETPIKFLFWEFTFSLWFALAITIVLTLIAERLGGWAWRRNRRTKAEQRD